MDTLTIFQAPRGLDSFVGRTPQIQELTEALKQGEPVLICGRSDIEGLGRTELAIHIAHRLRDVFRDGVLWVDVPTLRPADTLVRWARRYGGWEALGHGDLRYEFRPLSGEEQRSTEIDACIDEVYRVLRRKRVLAVLDGAVDQLDDKKLKPLLDALSDCAVIVTSRSRHWRLLKEARTIVLDGLSEAEAWELFTRVVGAERLQDRHGRVAEIAQVVDFLPLALDLLAAQLREDKTWTLEALLEAVRAERKRLETTEWGYGTARGLRAAIGVSYARLSAEDQKFFAALGVFAGEDFDRDAAADVTESAPDAADKTLARLGRRSLVQAERHAGRFKLHPAWARYAREQLTDMDAERRMAAYYCALAQEQGRKLQGAEMHAAMAVLDAEVSNIFAGQAWARACNDSTGWVLCRDYIHGAMDHYFSLRSMWNDWIAWSITGLEACRKLGDEHNGAILANSLGMVYLRKGEWNQAIEFYQRARVALEKLGDWRALATIYMNLGSAQTQKGDWQNAIIALGRALQLHERLGDLHGLAQARANLGVLYAKHGEKDKARANWNQALEIFDHLKLEHEADIVRKWLKAG